MNQKGEKIQKHLASSGVGSRRACEKLVEDMRVTINGNVAQRGDRVVNADDVRLDGSRIRRAPPLLIKLYKPKGFLCTDESRPDIRRARDLIPRIRQRLFPVGRLDKDFEGLVLYTNDGDLCHRLTHPRYGMKKLYEVRLNSFLKDDDVKKLTQGIWLSEGKTSLTDIKVGARSQKRTIVTLVLTENRRRLIPRLFAKLDYGIDRIKRIGVGPIRLRGLKEGEARPLDSLEIKALKKIIASTSSDKTKKDKD